MKANAPKKIYLSTIDLEEVGHLLSEANDKDDVEYTRTDAFIEKACSYLDSIGHRYIIEQFKNYMKGE